MKKSPSEVRSVTLKQALVDKKSRGKQNSEPQTVTLQSLHRKLCVSKVKPETIIQVPLPRYTLIRVGGNYSEKV